MLSLVKSSCSSSKGSEAKADERDSNHLPFREANPVVRFGAHTKKFSIRDHVLASRSKNIGASWPFPPQLLQICLKNGIRDLLPPFEPPSCVRSAHCLVKPLPELEKSSSSLAHLGQTVLIDETGEMMLNKSNLIKKPEVNSETSREEEIISSTSMVSDTMASKVCPVCKAFSSTSNTTLNAHMDQCLSMESDATLAVKKIQKIRVTKPRKKRLLVDIYATTSICTLEDLDRRNGTSWATDLKSAALTVERNSEPKKPKLAESDARAEKSEGTVYVDSNGIKIRILSKINDPSDVLSKEDFRPRKNMEAVGDGTMMTIKKDHSGASSSKNMKLKLRNKKLRSLKLFEKEVQSDVSHHEESHIDEEGSPVHQSGSLEKSLICGSATLKNWPSSKRSDLQKKSGHKGFKKIFQHLKPASDTPSTSKGHFGKLSRLSESKTMDFPSSTVRNMENEEKDFVGLPLECTTTNVPLKLSRVSGSLVSSPSGTGEAFSTVRKQTSHTSPKTHQRLTETCRLLPKTKKMSNFSASDITTIKMRKHRSLVSWTTDRQRSNPTGASSEDADACTIIQKSLVDEEREEQVNANDKTCVAMPIGPTVHDNIQTPEKLEKLSACLTRHEVELDNPRKNLSIAIDHIQQNQDNSFTGGREPSVSPTSTATTISPGPDYHSNASELKHVLNPSTARENLSFSLPFTVLKEGNQEMDVDTNQLVEKPCCCSWLSIMAGNMKQKPLSNLFIRPTISCFYANSGSRTDPSVVTPSMESPTESILTKAFSDVGSTSPSCGTPIQSSSNSILRLMGKDLMVVNNEASTQISNVHSPTVQGSSSTFGLPSSHASIPNHDSFSFAIRNQSPLTISLQERNLLPDDKAYMAKEVILIDDSDEVFAHRDAHSSTHTMFQRPFSYFPPHAHFLPVDDGIRPSNPINQVSSFPASHLASPFVLQPPSAARFNSSFHYPQSLR